MIFEHLGRRYFLPKGQHNNENNAWSRGNQANNQEESDLTSSDGVAKSLEGGQQSQIYKAMVSTGTDATTSAYNAAKSNLTANANAAGFGQASPAAQGGNAAVSAQEAKEVSAIPTQALQKATDYGIQGAGIQSGNAGVNAGTAGNYENAGVSLYNNRQNNKNALYRQMIQSGSQAYGSYANNN